MRAKQQRLYINIDHVATLRQARRGVEPDPVEAAAACEAAGADGITAHLREDRRHIQDADIERLKKSVSTYFNLEMACVAEMLERCRAAGVQLIDETPRIGAEGKRIAFLHPRSTGGVLVELSDH